MFSNYENATNAEIRAELAAKGVRIVEKPNRPPRPPRFIKTTYYAFGKNPCKETEIKVTWSTWADFAARNAFYALSQNKYSKDGEYAGIVEIVDEGNFHELCTVLTRDVEGNVHAVFKRDPKRPRLVLPD